PRCLHTRRSRGRRSRSFSAARPGCRATRPSRCACAAFLQRNGFYIMRRGKWGDAYPRVSPWRDYTLVKSRVPDVLTPYLRRQFVEHRLHLALRVRVADACRGGDPAFKKVPGFAGASDAREHLCRHEVSGRVVRMQLDQLVELAERLFHA